MWLVIHIPKTAGTSFRWALEKQFGQSQVVRDYGPASKHTSEIVRKHLYEENQSTRPAELIKAMSGVGSKILIGHVPLQKYANYFKPENIITFVRDPLVRTCSEYLHRVNNRTFEGSLYKFLQQPGFQNQQSRLLKGVSRQSFIGIAENYSDCLTRINSANHWELSPRKKNVGRHGGGRKLAESLSVQELDLFYKTNQNDLELYQESKQCFDDIEVPTSNPGF